MYLCCRVSGKSRERHPDCAWHVADAGKTAKIYRSLKSLPTACKWILTSVKVQIRWIMASMMQEVVMCSEFVVLSVHNFLRNLANRVNDKVVDVFPWNSGRGSSLFCKHRIGFLGWSAKNWESVPLPICAPVSKAKTAEVAWALLVSASRGCRIARGFAELDNYLYLALCLRYLFHCRFVWPPIVKCFVFPRHG